MASCWGPTLGDSEHLLAATTEDGRVHWVDTRCAEVVRVWDSGEQGVFASVPCGQAWQPTSDVSVAVGIGSRAWHGPGSGAASPDLLGDDDRESDGESVAGIGTPASPVLGRSPHSPPEHVAEVMRAVLPAPVMVSRLSSGVMAGTGLGRLALAPAGGFALGLGEAAATLGGRVGKAALATCRACDPLLASVGSLDARAVRLAVSLSGDVVRRAPGGGAETLAVTGQAAEQAPTRSLVLASGAGGLSLWVAHDTAGAGTPALRLAGAIQAGSLCTTEVEAAAEDVDAHGNAAVLLQPGDEAAAGGALARARASLPTGHDLGPAGPSPGAYAAEPTLRIAGRGHAAAAHSSSSSSAFSCMAAAANGIPDIDEAGVVPRLSDQRVVAATMGPLLLPMPDRSVPADAALHPDRLAVLVPVVAIAADGTLSVSAVPLSNRALHPGLPPDHPSLPDLAAFSRSTAADRGAGPRTADGSRRSAPGARPGAGGHEAGPGQRARPSIVVTGDGGAASSAGGVFSPPLAPRAQGGGSQGGLPPTRVAGGGTLGAGFLPSFGSAGEDTFGSAALSSMHGGTGSDTGTSSLGALWTREGVIAGAPPLGSLSSDDGPGWGPQRPAGAGGGGREGRVDPARAPSFPEAARGADAAAGLGATPARSLLGDALSTQAWMRPSPGSRTSLAGSPRVDSPARMGAFADNDSGSEGSDDDAAGPVDAMTRSLRHLVIAAGSTATGGGTGGTMALAPVAARPVPHMPVDGPMSSRRRLSGSGLAVRTETADTASPLAAVTPPEDVLEADDSAGDARSDARAGSVASDDWTTEPGRAQEAAKAAPKRPPAAAAVAAGRAAESPDATRETRVGAQPAARRLSSPVATRTRAGARAAAAPGSGSSSSSSSSSAQGTKGRR